MGYIKYTYIYYDKGNLLASFSSLTIYKSLRMALVNILHPFNELFIVIIIPFPYPTLTHNATLKYDRTARGYSPRALSSSSSTYSSSSSSSSSDSDSAASLIPKILSAALPHVPTHGRDRFNEQQGLSFPYQKS